MLRRKAKKRAREAAAAPEAADQAGAQATSPETPAPEMSAPEASAPEMSAPEAPTTQEPAPAGSAPETAAPEEMATEESAAEPAPAEPVAASVAGNGGAQKPLNQYLSVGTLLADDGRRSDEQMQQEAAAELMAVGAPSREMLLQAVPEASSPEEALRILEERQGEPVPDPKAGSLRGKDVFWGDASVYYRIRRVFEWGPQPGPYRRQPWNAPPGLSRPELEPAREKRRLASP